MLLEQFSLQLPQLEPLMTAGGGAPRDEEGGVDGTKASHSSTGSTPDLLDGESLTNVVKPVAYVLARKRGGGGEFDGALHITNFRLILQRTGASEDAFGWDDPSLEWVSFPMGCIKAITQADDDNLAITITAKDLRSCRMRLPANNALFVSTLTKIIGSMAAFMQSSPERSFAIGHAAAADRRRAVERSAPSPSPESVADTRADATVVGHVEGWLIYDEEAEFVRQGLIKPKSLSPDLDLDSPARTGAGGATKATASAPSAAAAAAAADEPPPWRLFHNRSHRLVPTYPLHFVVPAVVGDAEIRAVAAYRSKGRLPAVTWMDPETKAVLARSAQPLAGLGGKSCAEDARLLSLFGGKGKPAEEPLLVGAAAAAAAAADIASIPPKDSSSGSIIGSSSNRRRRMRGSISLPPQPRANRRSSTGGSGGDELYLQDEGEDGVQEVKVKAIPRAAGQQSGSKAKVREGGGGESSFLEAISSWTPPWSTSKVAVQDPTTDGTPGRSGKGGGGAYTAGSRGADGEGKPRPSRRQRQEEGVGRQVEGSGRSPRKPGRAADDEGVTGKDKGRGRGREGGGAAGRTAPQLCVLDARTAVAALGNQLVGKGIETGSGYSNPTQLVFSGIGNVHAVKDAFEEMRDSIDPVKTESKMDRWRDDSAKMVARRMSRSLGFSRTMDLKYALGDEFGGGELEETAPYTQWPRLLRQILGASILAARLLRLKGCSVLVHCSDGWDRTPQICSTAQLLLDPYFRTLEGFCVLIEKEWLSFGHKFWARCMGGTHENAQDEAAGEGSGSGGGGSSSSSSSTAVPSLKEFSGGQVREYDELSPVFLQFLDLAHNVVRQFPAAFEFGDDLLTFVAEHSVSGLYGTFLCDTERRRSRLKIKQRTVSIWTIVLNNREAFVNANYKETREPLWPSLSPTKIRLWERQHCRVPSLRPHHSSNASETALGNAGLWEDSVSLAYRLENGEFHIGVKSQGGCVRGGGGKVGTQ